LELLLLLRRLRMRGKVMRKAERLKRNVRQSKGSTYLHLVSQLLTLSLLLQVQASCPVRRSRDKYWRGG
jgi:hypothetical protein